MSDAQPLARRPLRQPSAPKAGGTSSAFWNVLVGAACGAVLAATATVAAVRSPAVQERLGLVRVDPAPLAARGTDPAACPPPAASRASPTAVQPEIFFSRERLWSQSP